MEQQVSKETTLSNLLLDYEVRSSLWARHISNDYLQKLAGKYYAWKVKTKGTRYLKSVDQAKELGLKTIL